MKESKGPFTFSINGTDYSLDSLKTVRSFIKSYARDAADRADMYDIDIDMDTHIIVKDRTGKSVMGAILHDSDAYAMYHGEKCYIDFLVHVGAYTSKCHNITNSVIVSLPDGSEFLAKDDGTSGTVEGTALEEVKNDILTMWYKKHPKNGVKSIFIGYLGVGVDNYLVCARRTIFCKNPEAESNTEVDLFVGYVQDDSFAWLQDFSELCDMLPI